MANNLENYDILGRLSKDSAYYKIKNKTTSEICVWKAIKCEDFTEEQLAIVFQKINERKCFKHPNIVQFHNHIHCENTNTLYIVTDYCKYGSLKDVVQRCLKENEVLDEVFLWHSIYHIACVLKLSPYKGSLNLENIFLDANYVAKLYFFNVDEIVSSKCVDSEGVITQLGILLYQLCGLQIDCGSTLNGNFSNMHTVYSEELKNFITLMCNSVDITLDSLLCHPTVLLKLTCTKNKSIFIKIPTPTVTSEDVENYQLRVKNLKAREASIKLREEKLEHREHCLQKREKKVALLERIAKEKFVRAELYLKQTRDTKASSSSGKSSIECMNKKLQLDDSSLYSAADDSFIKPSTAKLDIRCIPKPSNFSRTMSERKIRFKGHSPLKDLRNISRLSVDHRASKTMQTDISEKVNSSNFEDTDEIKNRRISLGLFKKSKKLFVREENSKKDSAAREKKLNLQECRPLSWTEESKKNAFNLLRVMNSIECEKNSDIQIKHTYL